MKKLITSVMLLLLIAGCSKDPVSPTGDESSEGKHLIEFTIDGFSQQLLPFADQIKALSIQASANRTNNSSSSIKAETNPGTALRDFVNAIEIKVVHRGNLVDSLRQYANDPHFGTYSKYHPAAVNDLFHIFISAAKLGNEGDLEMRRGKGDTGEYADFYTKVLPDPVDAFFIHHALNISSYSSPQKYKLKRFVGRLEINLTEKMPAEVHKIEVTIENTAQYLLMMEQRGYRLEKDIAKDSIPYKTVKVIDIQPEDRDKQNFTFEAYFVKNGLLNGEGQNTIVSLKAFDANNNLIRSKIIPNVQIQTNMRTKLTGHLFTVPNLNFNIELESAWNTNVPELEF